MANASGTTGQCTEPDHAGCDQLLRQVVVEPYSSAMNAVKGSSDQMGDVGKRTFQKSGSKMAYKEIQGNAEAVLPLENGASIECSKYIRD